MQHRMSPGDRQFKRDFETLKIAAEAFEHAAHVRLAYVYLCENSMEAAAQRMKTSLLEFLAHLGVGEGKYHETLTRAWIMAANYFMQRSASCGSSDFMTRNPELLDSSIMLTHYSADVLFSSRARQAFVEPDIQSIPPPQ